MTAPPTMIQASQPNGWRKNLAISTSAKTDWPDNERKPRNKTLIVGVSRINTINLKRMSAMTRDFQVARKFRPIARNMKGLNMKGIDQD